MLHVSVICDHHQAFKILKCISVHYWTVRYNGSIADSTVLRNLSWDYNIIKYIELIIKLGKCNLFPLL
jgi:hypothetical protein